MNYAPIVAFAYNRPDHLKRTLEAVLKNPEAAYSDLYVFSDGPRKESDIEKVEAVRQFIGELKGFKSVELISAPKNKGLARSVIDGVTQVITLRGKAIIMEDDLLCTSDFLSYMNQALEKYENQAHIFSVSGYSFGTGSVKNYSGDTALVFRASSLGWGTWKDRWEKVDWEVKDFEEFLQSPKRKDDIKNAGEDILPMIVKQQRGVINSWAVRWAYHHVKHQGYCLIPRYSKIKTTGDDGSGSNPAASTLKDELHFGERIIHLEDSPKPSEAITRYIRKNNRPSLYRKLINWYRYKVW
ncbi:putative glycosyltransferase [Leadbetterella byssophila DSM 17132]|uniref:Glycosyltransferase n=1 Tax=Leadbetterella byssophila (strain DSM 17132 / JCM 16389 / KACC 11308 / NBRC 106382 / 4M15) TaxID=649349 RepID=E4RZQ1_LEAB4|nr:glycosyltransferase [Leadbetterella byssophila]ADQ18294.1 putative glycosyltransferase [Leadbetterella byssophila DSM 17132]